MSRLLTDYFKAVGTPQTMNETPKRKLSLKRKQTSQKSLNVNSDHNIINLVSDDEDMCEVLDSVCKQEFISNLENEFPFQNKEGLCDDTSNSTIIYTPGTPKKAKTPQSSNSKSPASREKFFSPIKKRNLNIKTPTKVKKNLANIMDTNNVEDQAFIAACMEMDDKTIFLLTIINNYLKNDELRPLLLKNSQELLSKCMNAKKPGTRLICRLYWRKKGWYRLTQIKQISTEKNNPVYDCIILEMLKNLSENGIIESSNCKGSQCDIGLEEYFMLLKLEELKSVCKDLKLKTGNKINAVECLRSYYRQKSNISNYFIGNKTDNATRVLKILSEKAGPCFRLTEAMRQTLNELYLLMYLGMNPNVLREKKLELTLIYDKIKRECYPDIDVHLDDASVVFKTRAQFERYIQAQNIYEDLLNATELSDKCVIVEKAYELYKNIDETAMLSYKATSPWLQRFTPPYIYVKILEAGLQDLKKTKKDKYVALALEILTNLISQKTFRLHKRAEWYAEKALILDKFMSDVEEAAKVLLEGFNSDLSEVAKDCLRPRALKMATRQTNAVSLQLKEDLLRHATKDQIMERNLQAKHIYKLPMDLNKNRGKIKFETRTADGRTVQDAEEFCKDHYIAEGKYTHGGHWEGRMVTTMFFLLFWDIIYARLAGVRGVFLTHYQEFPLDLFLPHFYVNRKALIEERLKEIEESPIENAVERMCVTWNARPETELSGIARYIGWENVYSLSWCLQPRALAAICRRLATDYGYSHSGFPDLTLWNENTKEVKFVEVKTDSDKPSMKQIQWMHYLQENGIETEFCYVGVNTKRCKARNNV